MQIILRIYIITCIMLVLFNIAFVLMKNLRNRQFYTFSKGFQNEVEEQFKNFKPKEGLPEEWLTEVDRKIRRVRHLITLNQALEQESKHRKELEAILRPIIFKQLDHYLKRPSAEQAYYAYVISCFDYSKNPAEAEFISQFAELLEKNSLYIFFNTMNAFYRFGDSYWLLAALEQCNVHGDIYHKKLLIDGLMTFNGDKAELDEKLKEAFSKYGPYVQESLLSYFRISSTDAKDLCQHILDTRKTDDEVLYAAMRYFMRFPSEPSKQYFMAQICDEQAFWTKRLLSIQAMESYGDPETRKTIKQCVTNQNWYIRTAAVQYFYKTHIEQDELLELLELRDAYANDALLYQYRNEPLSAGFIEAKIAELAEEDRLAEESDKAQKLTSTPAVEMLT